jgi:hypothetical protein
VTGTVDRIIDRLPGFYGAREKDSLLYRLINSFAKAISEQHKDIFSIMKSHWVDTAYGIDLDLLASIYSLKRKPRENDDDFRVRIRSAITDFRGGGTVEAVKTALARYLIISKDDIILVENPPVPMIVEKQARSRDKWLINSLSINDEEAAIIITIEDGEAREPTMIDTENNFSLKYNGTIKAGQKLVIHDGKADLDGVDVTANVVVERPNRIPTILRKGSNWLYRETLSDTLGRFNEAKFNENVFYKEVPPTKIRFEWTANMVAAFEVKVPSGALERNNISKENLENLVNDIKAAGVKTFVTIAE